MNNESYMWFCVKSKHELFTRKPSLVGLPMPYFCITSAEATDLSIWTIWPIFSCKVILFIRSRILAFNGCFGSLYFKYSACDVTHTQRITTNAKTNLQIFIVVLPQTCNRQQTLKKSNFLTT